jgi:beta-N-acetylhexosaminidase
VSGASLSSREPLAVILGCAGPELSAAERAFFRDADPLGFILFQRNCRDPDQVRALVAALRDAVGRGDAPVLIDQEGGRVARLKPPHWPAYPAPAAIAALGGDKALEAARAAARLIADDVSQLGITVDCVPVLDMPVPGADAVIGDRAWGRSPEPVAALGRAVCESMLAGGVLPVIKHMPGHGRATVDTHRALPMVKDSRETLEASDFAPFRALRDMPWGMTAHIVYAAIDAERPGTLSPSVIAQVIRGAIGFDGVLITDDLSMRALGGSFASRSAGALAAGCDLALHCNGDMTEMKEVVAAVSPLTSATRRRVDSAETRRRASEPFDRGALESRFRALMAGEV